MKLEKSKSKNLIGYQIYPKSFCDIKDNDKSSIIKNIILKLDYLKELGIELLWLSPIFKSPMYDNGYDISDYKDIDPFFGSIKDVEDLIIECEKRGIYVFLDLVINHTSNQHKWFIEALKDKNSPYRNYYIFRDGTSDGKAPSNWRSVFGGSCWEKVPNEENVYYYHTFATCQPDLNWDSEELMDELKSIIKFWSDKGIAGFRIDAINHIKKSEFKYYPQDAKDGLVSCAKYGRNQNGIEVYYNKLKKMLDDEKLLSVCEAFGVPYEKLDLYIGTGGTFTMMFDFNYTEIGIKDEIYCSKKDWTVKEYRDLIYKSQLSIQKIGWSAPFLENHDQPRSINKLIKDSKYYRKGATALATLLLTLRGTPFIYQGEEFGMTNCKKNDISEFNDIKSIDQYDIALKRGFTKEEALGFVNMYSRDNARTLIDWNIANDDNEIFSFYKKLIKIRKESEALKEGIFVELPIDDNIISYKRVSKDSEMTIIINLSDKEVVIDNSKKSIILSNYDEYNGKLMPYQIIIY